MKNGTGRAQSAKKAREVASGALHFSIVRRRSSTAACSTEVVACIALNADCPRVEHMIAIAVLISTAERRAFIAGVAYLSKMCYMEPVSFGMVDVVWRPEVCVRLYVI